MTDAERARLTRQYEVVHREPTPETEVAREDMRIRLLAADARRELEEAHTTAPTCPRCGASY